LAEPAIDRSPVVAVGAVALREGALLLVQRANPPEAGRWTLPGGRVQLRETLAQAVVRELREETGLEARCGPLRGWAERITEEFHYLILDFDVELESTREPTAGTDAAKVAWVSLDELDSVDLVSGLLDFLRDNGVRE
jgi:8-oxo-dGTP diphosphatase